MNPKTRRGSVCRTAKLQLAPLILALALAILGAHGAIAEDGGTRRIDALAYDASAGVLLKSDEAGLYRSSDAGRTWEAIAGPVPPDGDVTSIAVTSGEDGTIYAAGPGLGLLRASKADGEWVPVDTGLPSGDIAALAAHATQPETLYAYLPESGIYRTKDAGANWKLMDRGPEGIRQLIHTNLAGSMETGWLYAATADGVRFSMDCFCLWREAVGVTGPVNGIAVDPAKPERLYAASNDRVFISSNGGQDWEAGAPLPEAVTAVITTPSGELYAGSAGGWLFRSLDGAKTWGQVGE